jgi:hypothetical protein
MNVVEFFSVTSRQRALIAAIATAAFISVPGAVAGGPFARIVGVGAKGAWAAIKLNPTGPRSDSVLGGRAVAVSSGGYVRIYPLIGGLPGIPGRFYPSAHVLCLYWNEPVSNCSRLSVAGVALLAPLAGLPLLHEAPTTPPNAIALSVLWRGPNATRRPSQLFLTPTGVYASRRLFPLQRGPWCYLAVNLPDASAFLIEATTRVCK